jgi:hypothetical protein
MVVFDDQGSVCFSTTLFVPDMCYALVSLCSQVGGCYVVEPFTYSRAV